MGHYLYRFLCVIGFLLVCHVPSVKAQAIETIGNRALGMGGAFVAVASDSSATWWNPAGLAAGALFDISLGRVLTESSDILPARQERASWFAVGTPPLGISYYRFSIEGISSSSPTGSVRVIRSFAASQLGVTLLHTIVPGLHVGTTLKYLRGELRTGSFETPLSIDKLFGRQLNGNGGSTGTFDVDVGFLGVTGPFRIGFVIRNVTVPSFSANGEHYELPRHARFGVAFDGEQIGKVPLIVAVDVDINRINLLNGREQRNLSIGTEYWLWRKRLGFRAGTRFNMVTSEQRVLTAGLSFAPKSGVFIDAFVARGAVGEAGWGVASRVSF
jgi:hypothetical protein